MKFKKFSMVNAVILSSLWPVASFAITPTNGWADSYSSNGTCYCATTYDHGIGEYTVDTPAGSKTVREVCEAVGPGPGKGSNPVYNTVQCGNPPGHTDAITINGKKVEDEQVCPGRVDLGEGGCDEIGPTWDLSVFGNVQEEELNIPGRIEAENSTSQQGTKNEDSKDDTNDINVGHIENGDYLSYTANVEKSGTYNLELRVASPRDNSVIALSVNGTEVDQLNVPDTDDWQVWTTIETEVTLAAGEQTLRLDFSGNNSGGLLNVNWLNTTYLDIDDGGVDIDDGVEKELDNSNWNLSSSINSNDLYNAIDDDLNSRWTTTSQTQRDGQFFEIDLNTATSFDRIVLNSAKSDDDQPRAYEVYVSNDGNNWGTAIINGAGDSNGITDITFTDQSARFIRIEQNGSSNRHWWSIHEVQIFANSSDDNTVDNGQENESNCTGTYDLPTCVQTMSNNGGGTVILDSKTYLLSKSIILQDNVNIIGQGSDTVITWDDAVKDTIDEPFFYAEEVNDIALKNFKVLCTIDQDPNSSDLRNDHMAVFLNGGGDPSSGEAADNNNIYMESIEALYCSNGMHIKGANGLTLIDLNLHHNGNTEVDLFHNIYFRRVGDVVMKQTDADSGGFYASPRGHGIRMSHMINVYYENLTIFDNADHGLHFTDGVYNVRLHNVDVYDNCANSSGACGAIKCYGSSEQCDIDYDAAKE